MSMTRNVETTLISNEFQPKGNNDMMQCVTCNKSYLFCTKTKSIMKTKKKTPNVLEAKDTNSFLYEIEA